MEPALKNIPTLSTPTLVPVEIIKPKYWKHRLFASMGIFIVAMGIFQVVIYLTKGEWTRNILVGAVMISLGVAIVFFFVYWVISSIGRKFGNKYAVILWILLIGSLVGWYGSWLYKTINADPIAKLAQEESVVLPPGTDLSEFPSYIEIDKSRIVNLPGGGMAIPKSAIKFVMKYEDCLTTTDPTAQKGCANKYSLERKDVSLCKSMISLDNMETGDSASTTQQECVAQYAIVHKDVSLCNSLENKFINNSCFGGIVDQLKDVNECGIVFKAEVDIKDCVAGVSRNEEIKKEKEKQQTVTK